MGLQWGPRMRTLTAVLLLLAGLSTTGCADDAGGAQEATAEDSTAPAVTMYIQAAASLTDPLNEIADVYMATHSNVSLVMNFDSSGTLQAQIENGAPADVFFSAATSNMDALEEQGLILEESRRDLLENVLVVVVPAGSTSGVESLTDLSSEDVDVVAMGDPESVPVGKYGAQALTSAGIAELVQAKIVLGKNAKAVISYVETKDADAGIVFKTDALVSESVDIVAEIDPSSHERIVYPAALVAASTESDAASEFLDFLSSTEALTVFEEYGFRAVR